MAKKTNCVVHGVPKYRYRPNDPNCDKANFFGNSKKEAMQMYEDYMKEKVVSAARNFIDLFNDWLEVEKKGELKLASYNRYLSLKSTWIDSAPFAKSQITFIDSLIIKKYLNEIEQTGSKATAHRIYLLLASFFKYADGYYIDKNPMLKVGMPKYEPETKKKYYTPEEVAIIEAKAYKPEETIFLFALFTGMRQGEIMALQVKDVDLKNKIITVNKTLNRTKKDGHNQVIIGSPKTEASARQIPIKDSLLQRLEQHVFIELTKFNKLGIKRTEESHFFTSTFGKQLRGDRLTAAWKLVQLRMGIEPLNFHSLRHTHCTLLARAGVRLEVASKLMGHDKIETTAEIYIHVSQEDKKEAIEAINSMTFSKPSGNKLAT